MQTSGNSTVYGMDQHEHIPSLSSHRIPQTSYLSAGPSCGGNIYSGGDPFERDMLRAIASTGGVTTSVSSSSPGERATTSSGGSTAGGTPGGSTSTIDRSATGPGIVSH